MKKGAARTRKPRLRGDKRERTRAQLIESAAAVIGEKGLDATSLEEIATHAGMSRGAIYNNFADKEELFLAVAMSRWTPVVATGATEHEVLIDRLRRHGKAVADAAESRRREAAGAMSFVQYALRNPALQKRIAHVNAAQYDGAAKRLEANEARQLTVSVDVFVKTVHALTEGLIILHALTPHLISREVIESAFVALAPCGGSRSRA